MTAPTEFGGRGFSQMGYCRLLEVIGARCSSTAIFVNAHHSIGMRALLLFGTDEQKQKWLPDLVSGRKLAAFALTEPEAGSDAANVQTTATPTADGSGFVLNGEKRYITNGAIADVLTVMARTPVPGSDATAITAFLVTPDMPGFEVVEARMEKLGVRGTATARLAFHDMLVPRENILGPLGKGLKVALTVLDFGRTTFGACCTGAAKTCLRLASEHARTRRQFGRTLAEFELVQKKLARMAAWTYAHGSDDDRHGRPDRPRPGRLHARDRDAQGLEHRAAVDDRQRRVPDSRRRGLLHRPPAGTHAARSPHQPDRRRGERGARCRSSRWSACAARGCG